MTHSYKHILYIHILSVINNKTDKNTAVIAQSDDDDDDNDDDDLLTTVPALRCLPQAAGWWSRPSHMLC